MQLENDMQQVVNPEEQEQDRGRMLYSKFSEAITKFVIDRKQEYFDSIAYRGLKNNCVQMDQYIDNSNPQLSNFVSDVTPQVIRRGYIEYTSLFNKFLETDPLFSVRRGSKTNPDQEKNLVEILHDNLEKTYFRERTQPWYVDHLVRYGTSPIYTFAVDDYNANTLMTVRANEGYEEGQIVTSRSAGSKAVISIPIHPLNVIFDYRSNYMVAPDYMGFIGDICINGLIALADNPNYIAENVNKAIKKAKQGTADQHYYSGPKNEKSNFVKGHTSIAYLWMKLPIEGNEKDNTWYAIELVGEDIIRIEENPLDGDTIPLSISRMLPRQYVWYGNSPLVDKICIQNLQYYLINTSIEATARDMDRIILYRQSALDLEAINNRHTAAGLVPVSGEAANDLEKIMFSPQFPNMSARDSDYLMQLTRREDQDSSAIPNFNPQSEGGPSNKTLGGAQMMASIGEMKMSNFVNQAVVGLKDVAKHQIVLLRNIVDDTFTLSNGSQKSKADLIGDFNFSVKISNVFNYMREGVESANRLTTMINWAATKNPIFKHVRMSQMVEDWLRNSLKRENIEDYLDMAAMKNEEQMIANPPPIPPMPPQIQGPAGSEIMPPVPGNLGQPAAPQGAAMTGAM